MTPMPTTPASRTETTEPPDADVARRAMIGRAVPVIGTTLVSLGLLLIVLLHVLPPSSSVNPLTRTISEYALGANRWLFDIAVIALAVGSIAILLGLVRARLLRPLGTASLLIGVWAVCLVVLVVFQKYDYQNGQSTGPAGMIHRMASLAAFLSLPTGALLVVRRAQSRIRPAVWTRRTALTSWLFLSVLFYAVAQSFVTGVAWWRVFPLGAMERLIGIGELAVLLALGCWAIVASPPTKAGD